MDPHRNGLDCWRGSAKTGLLGEASLLIPQTQAMAKLPLRSRGRARTNAAQNALPVALTRAAKIIVDLQAEPSFRRNSEICSQPECRIRGNRTRAIHGPAVSPSASGVAGSFRYL